MRLANNYYCLNMDNFYGNATTFENGKKISDDGKYFEKDILVIREYFHTMQSITVTIILLSAALTTATTYGTWLLQNVSADKNIENYTSIKKLAKDIDNGNVDDDNVDWNDFKNSAAFKNADDDIQECISDAEHLGDNLGDYEILECVDEYN